MTSPSAQPTIADAVRFMDSLSILPSPRKAPTANSMPDLKGSMKQSLETTQTNGRPLEAHKFNDSNGPHSFASQDPNQQGVSSATTAIERRSTIPSLPAEILFHIATFLLPALPTSQTFPCKHCSPPYTALLPAGSSITPLLSLASASRTFRNILTPLVWHTIVIRTPQHLPRLATLLKNYDCLSLSSTRRSFSPASPPQSQSPVEFGLRHPLPHIRSIAVSIPDKYLDFDQTYLLTLLRSMPEQVEHLYWSAEAPPNPTVWLLLGPSLRGLEVDGRLFHQGHKGMAGLKRLETLRFTGYESTLLPAGVVALFQAQSLATAEIGEGVGEVREIPEGYEEQRGRQESPLQELQRSSSIPPRRQAQHLYLDPPPPSSSTPPSSPSSPAPSNRARLKHLSLSTSKTSLFHQLRLLLTSSFNSLTCLDIYPITPEPPLPSTILSLSSTLTHLRLIFDISGAFSNYNSLWSTLTSRLPHLMWLEVDPMPQQNTAPSFWDFVESCPRLEYINGKKKESFPPSFGPPSFGGV